jgi:hypothetical protein
MPKGNLRALPGDLDENHIRYIHDSNLSYFSIHRYGGSLVGELSLRLTTGSSGLTGGTGEMRNHLGFLYNTIPFGKCIPDTAMNIFVADYNECGAFRRISWFNVGYLSNNLAQNKLSAIMTAAFNESNKEVKANPKKNAYDIEVVAIKTALEWANKDRLLSIAQIVDGGLPDGAGKVPGSKNDTVHYEWNDSGNISVNRLFRKNIKDFPSMWDIDPKTPTGVYPPYPITGISPRRFW